MHLPEPKAGRVSKKRAEPSGSKRKHAVPGRRPQSAAARTKSGAAKRKSNHRRARVKRKRPGGASGSGAKRGLTVIELEELNDLRAELERTAAGAGSPLRWNADPSDVQRSVAQLVLTLVEFIRRLLERQAIRRMEAGTLTPDQIESVGQALMKLEETVRDIAAKFGISPEELNLELGPVGKLM